MQGWIDKEEKGVEESTGVTLITGMCLDLYYAQKSDALLFIYDVDLDTDTNTHTHKHAHTHTHTHRKCR